jgi:hypothetical protein
MPTKKFFISHADIRKINLAFLNMEHVSLTDAVSYLHKKARAGKGYSGFQPPPISSMGPAAKKPRQSTSQSESGSITCFVYTL